MCIAFVAQGARHVVGWIAAVGGIAGVVGGIAAVGGIAGVVGGVDGDESHDPIDA